MSDPATVAPVSGAYETIDKTELEALERYDITRVSGVAYLVGLCRYSNLADAIAQAHRASGARKYFKR